MKTPEIFLQEGKEKLKINFIYNKREVLNEWNEVVEN